MAEADTATVDTTSTDTTTADTAAVDTAAVDAGKAATDTAAAADAGKADAGKVDTAATDAAKAGDAAADKAPPAWPEDWRQKLAGKDEKLLRRLERFASPDNVFKSWLEAEQKIRSGDYKRASLPKDATPEQVAEFRKEVGIPEKPEEYDTELGDGLVLGEQDKALVPEFLKAMHEANAPQPYVKAALAAYANIRQQEIVAVQRQDASQRAECTAALQAEYGGEFEINRNLVSNLLETLPQETRDRLMSARLGDGTALFNDPTAFKFFVDMAREAAPVGALIPGGPSTASGINDRMATLQKMMGDYSSDYWKGPRAAQLQAEYETLLGKQQKSAARAA